MPSHPSLNLLHHMNTCMTQFVPWRNVCNPKLYWTVSCLCVRWYWMQ
jgi:hypothetical protein